MSFDFASEKKAKFSSRKFLAVKKKGKDENCSTIILYGIHLHFDARNVFCEVHFSDAESWWYDGWYDGW